MRRVWPVNRIDTRVASPPCQALASSRPHIFPVRVSVESIQSPGVEVLGTGRRMLIGWWVGRGKVMQAAGGGIRFRTRAATSTRWARASRTSPPRRPPRGAS